MYEGEKIGISSKKEDLLTADYSIIFTGPFTHYATGKKQPMGEYITTAEVQVLTRLLTQIYQDYRTEANSTSEELQFLEEKKNTSQKEWEMALKKLEKLTSDWKEENLTYGQFLEWKTFLQPVAEIQMEFTTAYKPSFALLKEDWYVFFDQLCAVMDPEGKIQKEELLILGDCNGVKDVEGRPIEKNSFFLRTDYGRINYPLVPSCFRKKENTLPMKTVCGE